MISLQCFWMGIWPHLRPTILAIEPTRSLESTTGDLAYR
jgi:hypothetical protein